MKSKMTFVYIGSAIALYLLFKSSTASAIPTNNAPEGSSFDLSQLPYSDNSLQALNNLYNALLNASNPDTGAQLSTLQQQFALSQALQETGLFTHSPNWSAINVNNFGGIMPNGKYQSGNGTRLANYPDIPTFVNAWLNLLTIRNDPLQASSVSDFIQRLLSNGYIVQADVASYQQGLPQYFNLLTSVAQ
jgi:hypothetical protein